MLRSEGAGPGEFNSLRIGHPLQRCLNVVSYLLSHPSAEPFAAAVSPSLASSADSACHRNDPAACLCPLDRAPPRMELCAGFVAPTTDQISALIGAVLFQRQLHFTKLELHALAHCRWM